MIRLIIILKFDGKSFICVFFTKRCRAGCKFCFFKSNNKKLNDINESYEMSDYGFERFLKFVNESNNGYLLISGGGEPFEKKEYVFKTVESAISDKIVIVSNGLWAKEYEEAKEIIDKLYMSLSNRIEKTDVTLRISIDAFHAKQFGIEPYENIIKIFENDYLKKSNFHLKIHTIMSDDTVYKLAIKNNYVISEKSYYNTSDNDKVFKLIPQKYYIYKKTNIK